MLTYFVILIVGHMSMPICWPIL